MKYYSVSQPRCRYYGLDDIYDDDEVAMDPDVRKELKEFFDLLYESEEFENQMLSPRYRRFYKYVYDRDYTEQWCGDENGYLGCERYLSYVCCPNCRMNLSGWGARYLPFRLPRNFWKKLKQGRYDSFDEFFSDVKELEAYLLKKGFHIALRPGDCFAPMSWGTPLFWHKKDVFMVGDLIVAEQVAEKIRRSVDLSGVELIPLEIYSLFCKHIPKRFFALISSTTARDYDPVRTAIAKEGGEYKKCPMCGAPMLSEEEERQATIAYNIKTSSYRKKKTLPRSEFVAGTQYFCSSTFGSSRIVGEDLKNALEEFCPSEITFKELTIVDD